MPDSGRLEQRSGSEDGHGRIDPAEEGLPVRLVANGSSLGGVPMGSREGGPEMRTLGVPRARAACGPVGFHRLRLISPIGCAFLAVEGSEDRFPLVADPEAEARKNPHFDPLAPKRSNGQRAPGEHLRCQLPAVGEMVRSGRPERSYTVEQMAVPVSWACARRVQSPLHLPKGDEFVSGEPCIDECTLLVLLQWGVGLPTITDVVVSSVGGAPIWRWRYALPWHTRQPQMIDVAQKARDGQEVGDGWAPVDLDKWGDHADLKSPMRSAGGETSWSQNGEPISGATDLVSLLSRSIAFAEGSLRRQSFMSTPVISIKVPKDVPPHAEGLKLPSITQGVLSRRHHRKSAERGTKCQPPSPSQTVCVGETLQTIIRTLIAQSLRGSDHHECACGNMDMEELASNAESSCLRPAVIALLSEELMELTPDKQWCMHHALYHIGNIIHCNLGHFLKGRIRVQVESLCLIWKNGSLEGSSNPPADDAVPRIFFVKPPCLPLGPQGTAMVEVSLGRWQLSWRLLVVHNGRLVEEFAFKGRFEDAGQQMGSGERRLVGSDDDMEQILRVVVVVRETGLKMTRSVNLGEQLPGAIVFTIVVHPGNATRSNSTSTPLLIMSPDAAQEINTVFMKMVKNMEDGPDDGSDCEDRMVCTWRKCFKNLAVDIEYLLVSLPFWREWMDSDEHRREKCHVTLEKICEYLARNRMWETVAFLLKTFVKSSGTICIMGAPLAREQLTASFLKCAYVMTSHKKPMSPLSGFSFIDACGSMGNGHRMGARLPPWMSPLAAAPDTAPLLHENVPCAYPKEMESRIETWISDTMVNCSLPPHEHFNHGAPSGRQDRRHEVRHPTILKQRPPGRVREGWSCLRYVGQVLAVRGSVFGFRSETLEASYRRYVNRERATLDLAMVTARLVSCALLACQMDDAGRHLPQILKWNLIGPVLLVMLMVWGDMYEKKRGRVALSIRVAKLCSTLVLRMNWGALGRVPENVAFNGGLLIWEALVFPVWLQVSFRAQLVLGLPEALLVANACSGTSDGFCLPEWLTVATSYAASCAVVFSVECLFRRGFLDVRVDGKCD